MSLDILMTKNFYKKFPKKIMRVTFKSVLRKWYEKTYQCQKEFQKGAERLEIIVERCKEQCRKFSKYCGKTFKVVLKSYNIVQKKQEQSCNFISKLDYQRSVLICYIPSCPEICISFLLEASKGSVNSSLINVIQSYARYKDTQL